MIMNIRKNLCLWFLTITIGAVVWRTIDDPGTSPVITRISKAGDRTYQTHADGFIPLEPSFPLANVPERAAQAVRSPPAGMLAAEDAFAVEAPSLREELMRRAMQAWATTDPAAALAWASRLPDPGEADMAMLQVFLKASETDPATAIKLALDHHFDEKPGDLVGNLATEWADRDLPAASDWVNQQPAGEPRDALMERIIFIAAQTDPAAAARKVVEGMNPGERQTEAAIMVLHQWILRDFEAASAWVGLFPEGSLRDRARSELAGQASNCQKIAEQPLPPVN
ncbi:hypothetical protein [Luteolibacter sp.]|uniref:hypothetical protein n=2 Tax=Luteolibacter sp. TaxID=1962973 RepID=UPI003267187A